MAEGRFFEFGPFRVDVAERHVLRGGTPVPLTPKAFDTLLVLLRNRGRLVTKQELLRQIWPDTFVEESSLTFNISTLRKVLGQRRGVAAYIETVPRHGYRFIAKTTDDDPPLLPAVGRRVGRRREQAELASAFDAVRQGTGHLFCVTGEPGIGKTTLVEEFLEDVVATQPECRIGRGRCSERLAGTGAYLPLLEVLQSLCGGRAGVEVKRSLETAAPSWYAQVVPSSVEPGAALAAAAPSQERLKWELGAFFQEISRSRPVVLFFDDLHWADTSTVDLLAYLAGRFDSMHLLVLAAYRSSELLLARHPFIALKLDLQGRRRCHELPVTFLSRADTDAYLALEFPGHAFPEAFAALIYAKTEGNALFMVDLLRYLRDRGVLAVKVERWTLAQPMPTLERELPESTGSVIQRTIERLDAVDRSLLTAGSVQGYEFLSSVVAEVVGLEVSDAEDRLDALERIHGLLRRLREQELPDRTLTVRYQFVHVLHQDALYGSLTPGRKTSLSGAIAVALEAHYGERNPEIASELALLLSAARDFIRAAEAFLLAAQSALRLFANHEAIALARRGLALLDAVPETSQRDHLELRLQTVLGVSLMSAQGFGAPDAAGAYRRALTLCQTLEHHVHLFPVLSGLWLYYSIRGELQTACGLTGQMLQIAGRDGEDTLAVQAHYAAGGTLMDMGRFDDALDHLERAMQKHDPVQRKPYDLHTLDPSVACPAFAARVLAPRGYPDRALAHIEAALARARALAQPQSLALALTFAAIVHHFRGDVARTHERAEEAVALSREHGLVQTLAWATVWRGWALVHEGQADEGVAEMRDGLRACRAMGSEISRPQFLTLVAESLGEHGRADEGLALLTDALAAVEATGDRYCEAEIHRVRGRLFRLHSPVATPEAEESIQRALAVARAQDAKGWELRAAIELCHLRRGSALAGDAQATLESVYGWFTEGFETADVREAGALLSG